MAKMTSGERGKLYYRVAPIDAEPKFGRAKMRAWCNSERDKHNDAPSIQAIELIEALLPNGPKWTVFGLANIINHTILSARQVELVKSFIVASGVTEYDKLVHQSALVEQKQIEADGPRVKLVMTPEEAAEAKKQKELAHAMEVLKKYNIVVSGGEHPAETEEEDGEEKDEEE